MTDVPLDFFCVFVMVAEICSMKVNVLQITTAPCLQLKLKILRVLLIYVPVYSSHVPLEAPRVVNYVLSMT